MNKILILSFIFLLSDCTFSDAIRSNLKPGFDPNYRPSPTPISTPITTSQATPTGSPTASLVPIDDQWNQYTNTRLGFTIKVPKWVVAHDSSKPNYNKLEPIQIMEDKDTVYITSPSDYNYAKIQNFLQQTELTGPQKLKGNPITWAIIIQPASTEEDIRQYIKNRYGSLCVLDKITPVSSNYEDVKVLSNPPEDDKETCWMNFGYYILYSPTKKLLANWDVGQSIRFELNPGDWNKIVDEKIPSVELEMFNSFRFLD